MKNNIHRFNDVWFDNGLVVFNSYLDELEEDEIEIHKELTSDKLSYEVKTEQLINGLSEQIKGKIKNILFEVKDKKTEEKKQVKKDFVLIQEGKKIDGRVAFKETLFAKDKTKATLQEIYDNLDGEKKTCLICGRKFKKKYKNLQQASYPFVTKIKSLSGIRSGEKVKLSEYIQDYCPQCYLIGVIVWLDESLIYRTLPGTKSILILPHLDDLLELQKIKEYYSESLNNDKRYSNIKIEKERDETLNTPDKYSTLLSFYENFIRYASPDIECQNWYIIEIPLSGSVKNPKYFNIFLEDKTVAVLYKLIQNKFLFFRHFISGIYLFYNEQNRGRNFDEEKIIHENLCKAFIEDNFTKFAHAFLSRSNCHIGFTKEVGEILNQIIIEWRIKPMKVLQDEDIKTMQMAGQTIATLAGKHVSLFYKLEKSKSPSDFFKAVQEISRRFITDQDKIEGKTYAPSLSKLVDLIIEHQDNQKVFDDIRNIVLIYTSIKSHKPQSNKNEGETK